ncbi:lipopolysaccharide biosynthesis protein [Vibrio sp. DNB22_19_1]
MLGKLLTYSPVQLFSSIAIFSLIAIQTRILGLEEYGLLSVFIVISELLRYVTSQWIISTLLRFYPSANTIKKNQLASTLFILLLLSTSLVASLSVPIHLFLSKEYLTSGELSSILLLSISKSIFFYFVELRRLNEDKKRYQVAFIVQSLSSVGISILLLKENASVTLAIIAVSLSYFIGASIAFFKLANTKLSTREELIDIINYGIPIIYTGIISILASRIDRLALASIIGLEAAGLYSAVSNLVTGIISLIFMVIALPLYPEVSKHSGDKTSLFKAHKEYLNLLLIVAVPALVGLILVQNPLIQTFVGEEFSTIGIVAFSLISLSVFISNIQIHYIDHGLQFTNQTKYLPLVSLVKLGFSFTMFYIVSSSLNFLEIALVNLFASVISILLSMTLAIIKGFKYKKTVVLGKVLTSSISMSLVIIFISHYLIEFNYELQLAILVISGVISYSLLSLLLNVNNIKDTLSRSKKS